MAENKPLSIKEWSIEDRPREKLLSKGNSALTDAELLGIIIGSGSREETAVELSRRILLSVNHNLNELGRLSLDDLMTFKGIGEAKAISSAAALELGRRRKMAEAFERQQISSSGDAFELFHPILADLPHEEFWVALLNRSNRIIDRVRISQGGVSGTVTDVRLILKCALDKLASAMVLCHNHPSGNNKPSSGDIEITRKIKQAASLMDINVLDHIIIGNEKYYSFADDGMLS
jgi:DNA repair protein RadC